jgi:hypothetical protein
MGNPSARLRHETGNVTHWNPGAHAAPVHDDKSVVHDVDLPLLHEQDGESLLDGDRFEGWQQCCQRGGQSDKAIRCGPLPTLRI